MKWHGEHTMPVIGRGSEATVYLDERENRAVKHFDRAPVRTARRKATIEFERLQKAHQRTQPSGPVRVPAPGELRGARAAFSMERVEGPSLLDLLATGRLSGSVARDMAGHVAEGILLFRDLLADCTLDHVLPNPDGSVTFLDFGNGSEDENGIEPGGPLTAFIEVAGSTLYECSRPGRFRGFAEFDECARFIGYLAQELGLIWNRGLERKIWHSFAGRGLEDRLVRFVWYRIAGGANSRRMFRTIRRMMPSKCLPRLDTVFSFVWDFPADDLKLTNGVHKVVDGLMTALAVEGIHPVLLTLGDEAGIVHRNGYTIETYARNGSGIPQSLVDRIATEGLSAITILNGTFNTWNTRLGRALEQRDLPYAVQPHTIMDAAFFRKSRWKKEVYWWLFERRFLSGARAILTYSPDQASELASRGVDTPIMITMNGICDPVVPEEDRYAASGPVRFHFFGRIETQTKGLDLLLEATARVSQSEDIRVTIQGPDSGDRSRLEARSISLGLGNVVRFLDPVSSPNPILVMSEYDVSILPSRYEGFPTAAVEALMAARPLVCTRAGALAPRLDEDHVAIVVESTVAGLEEGMKRVIARRSEWPEMGISGRAWAQKHLEWGPIATDLLHQLSTFQPESA